MKKVIIIVPILVIALLAIAYALKPTDKTCIIGGVKAVWGDITPDPYKSPVFFEQFMNLNSKDVDVKDWVFFKQVVYTMGKDQKTVGIGAFKKVFSIVKPVELKN